MGYYMRKYSDHAETTSTQSNIPRQNIGPEKLKALGFHVEVVEHQRVSIDDIKREIIALSEQRDYNSLSPEEYDELGEKLKRISDENLRPQTCEVCSFQPIKEKDIVYTNCMARKHGDNKQCGNSKTCGDYCTIHSKEINMNFKGSGVPIHGRVDKLSMLYHQCIPPQKKGSSWSGIFDLIDYDGNRPKPSKCGTGCNCQH